MIVDTAIVRNTIIGEGPTWDSETGNLNFIDIIGKKLYSYHNETLVGEKSFSESIGFAAIKRNGGFIVGLQSGIYSVENYDAKPVFIADPESDRQNGRFNDGKTDPLGRIWAGTMSTALDFGDGIAEPDSSLYCMDTDHRVKKMTSGITESNGLTWNKDMSLFYHIDTYQNKVFVYDYDLVENEIFHKRVLIDIHPSIGHPDGMTIDDRGNLWIALWGGGSIINVDHENGDILEKIELPAVNITCPCFGGPGMDQLFVTTAGLDTDKEKYPYAGSVFVLAPGVTGAASYVYSETLDK